MFQGIGIGVIAAALVSLPQILRLYLPSSWNYVPGLVLFVGVIAVILQRWVLDRGPRDSQYHGLADLLIFVHKPMAQGTPLSWVAHGFVSFLLAMAGGLAGPEGAAIEWMQAIQMRLDSFSVKWFEQKRRTHVASILAAAVAAAFGAPFAGLLLTFELGVGGRSLTATMSALTAFLGSRWLIYQFSLPHVELHSVLPHFNFLDWKNWVGLLLVGVLGGVVGSLLVLMTRYTQESLSTLFKSVTWIKIFVGAVLLFFVRWVSVQYSLPPEFLMEQALWSKFNSHQLILIFFSQFLTFSLLVGALGTMGWIWPAVSLGAVMGCAAFQFMPQEILNLTPVAGLAGAVALWAVLLNAPLSGVVLAFELTQDFQWLLPVWMIALLGIRIRGALGVKPLLEYDLMSRGHALYLGRSSNVLSLLSVKDAMVTDYAWVYEHESQAEVHARAAQSPYPFLPVVSREGQFRGLLTSDLIQFETPHGIEEVGSKRQFLEAKDLVYRYGVKIPAAQLTDSLKAVVHWFDEFPCLPVLGADQKLLGLLLASHVRLAYEREVGRRSFEFVTKEKNE